MLPGKFQCFSGPADPLPQIYNDKGDHFLVLRILFLLQSLMEILKRLIGAGSRDRSQKVGVTEIKIIKGYFAWISQWCIQLTSVLAELYSKCQFRIRLLQVASKSTVECR